MKLSKYMHSVQSGWPIWLILLAALMLMSLVVTPASAASNTVSHTAQRLDNATSVGASIYITTGTLVPLFQSRINQQIPGVVSGAINRMVSTLPKQDQGWAQQMATTLIQPSAALTGLTTQSGGLATSLRVSLYPGDPQPINASMLVSLSVLDSSTIQVSAKPINGSPSLVNGPLSTFTIPLGQLNSISMTPSCGDAALAVNLQFPVALGHVQTQLQGQIQQKTTLNAFSSTSTFDQRRSQASPNGIHSVPSTNTNSYIELPASSLASIGNSIGDMPINSSTTAKNIHIGVQGSNLVINSDIYDSFWGKVGTATTTVTPTAAGGNLGVHVLSTTITVLNIFTFPYDTYNQQIQQTLNAKLNGALSGKFTVIQAAIGPNVHVPCAAGNSLVLTGSANLG
ncbi:MAG TPA: hypothetical protein VKP04_03100 [Ktedonobacteraceae bacterium]|nr:hypothetical protein [Ktedonobacteraceae bacterium]